MSHVATIAMREEDHLSLQVLAVVPDVDHGHPVLCQAGGDSETFSPRGPGALVHPVLQEDNLVFLKQVAGWGGEIDELPDHLLSDALVLGTGVQTQQSSHYNL